jgi:hypothetical protein
MALANRERVNMVIDNAIMEALRAQSAQTSMPMSRIIDQALSVYLGDKTQPQSGPFKAAIPTHHTIEAYVEAAPDSDAVKAIRDSMAKAFGGVIVSPVFIARWNKQRVKGTLLQAFADDDQSSALPSLDQLCASLGVQADIIANGEEFKNNA